MPRITDFFLVDTPAQDTVVIHSKIPEDQIPSFIGESFMKLGEYINQEGLTGSDCPFLRISGDGSGYVTVMVGNAVPKSISGNKEISGYTIPAGRKLFCYYQGDNSLMAPVYEEMEMYLSENGYAIDGGIFEYYLNGPEYGMDKLLTKIMVVLKDK